jgi:hypothetical protein
LRLTGDGCPLVDATFTHGLPIDIPHLLTGPPSTAVSQKWFERWASDEAVMQKLWVQDFHEADTEVYEADGDSRGRSFVKDLRASPPVQVIAPSLRAMRCCIQHMQSLHPSQVVSHSMLAGLDIISRVDPFLAFTNLANRKDDLTLSLGTGAPAPAALHFLNTGEFDTDVFVALKDTSFYQGTCLFVWPTHTLEFYKRFGFFFSWFFDGFELQQDSINVSALHKLRRFLNGVVPKRRVPKQPKRPADSFLSTSIPC